MIRILLCYNLEIPLGFAVSNIAVAVDADVTDDAVAGADVVVADAIPDAADVSK